MPAMQEHHARTVDLRQRQTKETVPQSLKPDQAQNQVASPRQPLTHRSSNNSTNRQSLTYFKPSLRRRVAVDSDDEEEPAIKVVQAASKASLQKPMQPKSAPGASKFAQTSTSKQPSVTTTPTSIDNRKAKKADPKPRQTTRSSPQAKEEIINDWPFAHFGKLHAQLNTQTSKKKPYKARKHGRPTQRRDIGLSPFLDRLPGEIRNRIYEEVIPQTRILICANKPKKEQAAVQKAWENEGKYIKLPRSRLYCMIDKFQLKAGFEVSTGLLLTCKQIRNEVELFMYSRTKFCFQSPKTVEMFMNTASLEGIKAIQSIELRHDGYGEPGLTEHIVHKQKHDRQWERTCNTIRTEMTALKSLRLEMRIHDWPVELKKGEKWHNMLTSLVRDKRLDCVEAHLKHTRFSDNKMRSTARMLENSMMTLQGRLDRDRRETIAVMKEIQMRRDAEKAYRATLPPQQAKKILKINIEECKVAAKKPVKTTEAYTLSVLDWEWRYGKGNTLGLPPPMVWHD